MPAPGVTYFPTVKPVPVAGAPTAPTAGHPAAAGARQVVTGYQLGPFSFSADSPIGGALGNLLGDSQAVAAYNAQKLSTIPDPSLSDQFAQYAATVGTIAGSALGIEAHAAGQLVGSTAQNAGPGVGAGVGAGVQGIGTGVNLAAGAAGAGVTAGLSQGTQGVLSAGGSVLSGLAGGLFTAGGGSGGLGIVALALGALLVFLLLVK